jgi:hypothetical protein
VFEHSDKITILQEVIETKQHGIKTYESHQINDKLNVKDIVRFRYRLFREIERDEVARGGNDSPFLFNFRRIKNEFDFVSIEIFRPRFSSRKHKQVKF